MVRTKLYSKLSLHQQRYVFLSQRDMSVWLQRWLVWQQLRHTWYELQLYTFSCVLVSCLFGPRLFQVQSLCTPSFLSFSPTLQCLLAFVVSRLFVDCGSANCNRSYNIISLIATDKFNVKLMMKNSVIIIAYSRKNPCKALLYEQ